MRWFERILMVLFGAFFAYGFVLALICIGAVVYVLGSTLIFGPPEIAKPTASASVQPVMQLNERAERLRAALMDTQSKVRQVLLNTAKGKSGLAGLSVRRGIFVGPLPLADDHCHDRISAATSGAVHGWPRL